MIVVTGGAGFIGSAIVHKLNQLGHNNIVIVDRLGTGEKWKNLNGLDFMDLHHKDEFFDMLVDERVPFSIDAVIHMGACSATTEKDADYLSRNNFRYSTELAKYCLPRRARFIYASSAATYGDGSMGYDDTTEIADLRPLNMYGYSKLMFDIWTRKMEINQKIVGLKFFNVYGPNEYHKGDMRSVVHKAFEQVQAEGKVKLFKSDREEYADGEQKRDFIYVDDVVDIVAYFLENRGVGGLYNVGTGKARSWNDLVTSLFNALDLPVNIEYIDMPDHLKGKYQYFTQATVEKIKKEGGYEKDFTSLEDGVADYVKRYLLKDKYYGLCK